MTATDGVGQPTVVCLGSLNMDMRVDVSQAPLSGETVMANSMHYLPGGKGANQALGCVRQGARVYMVGNVGADAHGASLVRGLQADGIDTNHVLTDPHSPTGVAMVLVEQTGQNRIVVVGGANQTLRVHAAALKPVLRTADVLVMQLETPVSEVLAAARLAQVNGCKVVLNPSPVQGVLPTALWPLVDTLVLNETEAFALCGTDVSANRNAAIQAVRHFQRLGVPRVVITLGGAGAVAADGEVLTYHPAPQVQVVDTTAAGDTFLGALAVGLARKFLFAQCVRQGIAAASLCVQTAGAQASIPTLAQTMESAPVPDWETL